MDKPHPTGALRPATPGQLAWLGREVGAWQAAGLVDPSQAASILGSYRSTRRLDLSRLALWLGAAFVGIGVLWLVASNLDRFPPTGRFIAVTVLWLGFVAAAEVLARRVHTQRSPVVGAVRGLAALAYGAVVMQAAQSLQVPAYDAELVGIWAAGALVYAYAVRGAGPLVVGVVLGIIWLVWHVGEVLGEQFPLVLALGALATAGFALGRLHDVRRGDPFGVIWRLTGALTGLAALFIAALPWDDSRPEVDASVIAVLVVAVLLAGLAVVTGPPAGPPSPGTDDARTPGWLAGLVRLEGAAGAVLLGLAVLLAWWSPDNGQVIDGSRQVGAEAWLQAILSIVAYVLVAAAVAAIGVVREEAHLTWLAVLGLALFTTVQAFAVFADIIDGAWLFVVLGLVFAGTGWVGDRARREMVDVLEGADR